MLTIKGGVIKKHLKESDAPAHLHKKAVQYITKKFVADELDNTPIVVLPNLRPFIDPMKEQIQEFKNSTQAGQKIIAIGLYDLNNEQLATLVEIAEKKSGGYTEEKLIQMLPVMWQSLNDIDIAITMLNRTKTDLLSFFVGVFAKEYHSYKAGSVSYNLEQFRRDVQTVIDFRRGALPQPLEQAEGNRCVIS
jgi:hypothetical protein